MCLERSEHVSAAVAHAAVALYGGDPASLEFVQHVQNAVWRFHAPEGPAYLRLTPKVRRTAEQILTELSWMAHLDDAGFLLAPPLRSARSALCERVDDHHACAFRAARGRPPDYESRMTDTPSRDWTRAHRIEIGRTVAHLHRLTARWEPPAGCGRWHWSEDDSLSSPLPPELERERDEVLEWMRALPEEEFGLIHADLLPCNWMLLGERLELIDFDDGHRSWFAYDLAVPAYSFTHAPEVVSAVGSTPQLLDDLVEGYVGERPLSAAWIDRLPGFVRFRRMLVLADCHRFGCTDTSWYRQHRAQLARCEPLV
jgi:Ser/Thr protein kinase RdoA (MazF antagonist)